MAMRSRKSGRSRRVLITSMVAARNLDFCCFTGGGSKLHTPLKGAVHAAD